MKSLREYNIFTFQRSWSYDEIDGFSEVEFGFGDIYSRPGMSLREREIATVALLTALGGRESQLRSHMEAAMHVGITLQELEEIVLQTVPYAGFPTAINATNILAQFKGEENLSEKESS